MSQKALPHLLSKAARLMIASGLLFPFSHSVLANTLLSSPVSHIKPLSSTNPLSAYRFHEDHILGTSFDMVVIAPGENSSHQALQAARKEIRRLDAILSQYRNDSELSLLNRSEQRIVSKELFEVIQASEYWKEKTQGGFNGRLGLALDLWNKAVALNQLPEEVSLYHHAQQAQTATVYLDKASRLIQRPQGVVFALDAIAKGYIIDAALEAARNAAPELAGLMIDIGGDVRCWGQAPRCQGWNIGLAHRSLEDNASASTLLTVHNKAVATSGKGSRDFSVNGQHYSHILTPDTGATAEHIIRATVVADTAVEADALSTAFTTLTPAQSIALADQFPGVEAFLISQDGQTFSSKGWHAFASTPENQVPSYPLQFAQAATGSMTDTASSAKPAWPSGFTTKIEYEVPKIDADTYRAPYLAIWITNENKELVKTLLVLGKEKKYLNSNYVWWRRFGRKSSALDTMTKPTRQPGRYQLIWDGLDEAGKAAGQGHYTLHIEASREHGGHSYESIEIDLKEAPIKKSLAPKDELGTINVRYDK